MVNGMKAALGVGGMAAWAAVAVVTLTPGNASAAESLRVRRDQSSCSSGGCTCSVKNTNCSCASGFGNCTAHCTSGGEVSCKGGKT